MNDAEITVWIVGQYRSGDVPNVAWDFQGVFESLEMAIKACRTESYFYFSVPMNVELPDEVVRVETTYPKVNP